MTLEELDELGKIYRDLLEGILDETDPKEFGEEKSNRLNELVYEIIDFMIDNPGALVYVEDKSKRKFYETVIDFTWSTVDSDQIIDRLFSAENEKLSFLIGDISNRAKKLKPAIIHIDPKKSEYTFYLEEAMEAWMYGLNNASLTLCFTVLENLLKDRLCTINIEYVYELKNLSNPKGVKTISFGSIIKSAYKEKLITRLHRDSLFVIKNKRNSSIHEMVSANSDEVYDIIIKTKDIVEHLLRN